MYEVDLPAASEPPAKSPWSYARASASNGLSVRRLAFQSFSTSWIVPCLQCLQQLAGVGMEVQCSGPWIPALNSSPVSCVVVCLRVSVFNCLCLGTCVRSLRLPVSVRLSRICGVSVFATIFDISTSPKTLRRYVTCELSHCWLLWLTALPPSRCCRLWSRMSRLVVWPRLRPRRTEIGKSARLRGGAA